MSSNRNRAPDLRTKGWKGFRYIYFYVCKEQFHRSLKKSCYLLSIILLLTLLSEKTFYEFISILADIGLRVSPPLLGFTLSGYALVVGVNDKTMAEKIKSSTTQNGITMYQQLYTTFIAMLGSIFLLLIESVVIYFALNTNISIESSLNNFVMQYIMSFINFVIFVLLAFTLSYSLMAIKDLLSNLFSLGQTTNNLYIKEHTERTNTESDN